MMADDAAGQKGRKKGQGQVPGYIREAGKKVVKSGPGIYLVDVLHEDDCGHWKGLPCDCTPEVQEPVRIIDPGPATLH
jgi:hypothetical protein